MTDERRVEVASEALYVKWLTGPTPTSVADLRDLALADARAVVAALDAHDGDLRERLAGAVEGLREPFRTIDGYSGARNRAFMEAARTVREVEL